MVETVLCTFVLQPNLLKKDQAIVCYDYAQMDHGQSSILCPRRTEKVGGEVRPFIAGLVFYLSV